MLRKLLNDPLPKDASEQVEAMGRVIRPVLAGRHPVLQSAMLAELLAAWLCGMPDYARTGMLKAHIEGVEAMIPSVEKMLYGGFGHPENRGGDNADDNA